MARYLLDTNTCIAIMRGHPVAVQRMAAVAPGDCAISTVTAYELYTGVEKCTKPAQEQSKVELLLTSGWCPFAARVLTEVKEQILGQPGISDADVSIVWDEAWTTDRLSPRARDILRFLPPPSAVADRDEYIRAHLPAKE